MLTIHSLRQASGGVSPLIPPCAPALQQPCKLKDEKSGGMWEEGLRSEGRGGSKEDRGVR